MEQLLLILFLLFSVISALLERRKRRRQLEEEQRRRQQTGEGPPPADAEPEKEEEEWGGWPFPGGDPFEPRPEARPAQQETEEGEVVLLEEAAPADGQSLLEQLERQAREAEERARNEEERARERAEEIQRTRRRAAARMREPGAAGAVSSDRARRRSPWSLTPDRARRAVVYAEILGPCKADREEGWRW